MLKSKITVSQCILSFIGWDSLGNSNWYMFTIFALYIFTMISLNITKNNNEKAISALTIITVIYMILISSFKEAWWYNTLLCYPFGFWYSYYKEKIDKLLCNNKRWIITAIISIFTLLICYYLVNHFMSNSYAYNLISIAFVEVIAIFMMKFKFNSKIFNFLGRNLFWRYTYCKDCQ